MDSQIVLDLLSLYAYISIGFIFGKMLKEKQEKTRDLLTQFLIYSVAPLQIFLVITTTTFNLSFRFVLQIILLAILNYSFMAISTFTILNKKGIEHKKLGAYMLLNSLPNVLFYTIPIIIALFSDALTVVSVIFASTTLILRGSVATYISERFGSDKKMKLSESVKKLLTFPPFIAILIGVITAQFQAYLPLEIMIIIKSPINTLASALGAILIGLILASINKEETKKYGKDIAGVALWRFGLAFVFYLCIVYFLHFDEYQTEIRTILLIIVMGPPAVFNVLFSVHFKLDHKFAAIAVAVITLFGLIILPAILFFGMAVF
jgi:predicted permease